MCNAGECLGETKLNSEISPTPASSQIMKKPENKAHPYPGKHTTTTTKPRQKIKPTRGPKISPPNFKVKKITEYFIVPRPPDESKNNLEAIKD